MFKEERQTYIFRQVNLHNKVLSRDLCEAMGVSEDTVRRDLKELSDAGKIIKVHGGALSLGFNQGVNGSDSDLSNIYALDAKRQIAEKAVRLIKSGMFILTTGGTTILEMVKTLPQNLEATFITGSIPVVNKLMEHPCSEVIVIGDKVSKSAKLTIGMEAVKKLDQLNADLGFIGTNALDMQHGLTDNDWDVVQVKRAVISASKKVVCMTISEKIPSLQPLNVCGSEKIDYLITELEPDDPKLEPFIRIGITVL